MAQIDDIERRLGKLEARFDQNLRDQNTVNAKAYKHIVKIEQRFAKMDKGTKKLAKLADPRAQERITMKLVDQALKSFDQKRGKS